MSQSEKKNKYLKPILGAAAGGTLGAVVGRTAGSIASIPFYALGSKIGNQSAKRLIMKGTIGGGLVGTGIGAAASIAANKYLQKVAELDEDSKNALKTFGKLTAIGAVGTAIGGAGGAVLGSKLAKTALGIAARKRSNFIARKASSVLKLKSKLKTPAGSVVGAFAGSQAISGVGDLATLHHDMKNNKQK